jgi:hypothetical protein
VASDIVLRSETVLDAPPEQVWKMLSDLAAWDTWNPTLFGVRPGSSLEPGREVRMKLRLGPVVMPMRQQVQVVDPPRELRWRSKQLVPAPALDVIRSFQLEPLEGGRTRLVQTEAMSGFLAKRTARLMGKLIVKGYDDLGRALATRVGERKG